MVVLNLVISGIPSILKMMNKEQVLEKCFKPCYKWNTFNTVILHRTFANCISFKPCYKWNTFNTWPGSRLKNLNSFVLNLIITGLPSILYEKAVENDHKMIEF